MCCQRKSACEVCCVTFLISCRLLIARVVCDTFFRSWKFICKGNRWSHLHLLNCSHKLELHFLFSFLNPLIPVSLSKSTSWVLLSNCYVDDGHDGGLSSAAWGAVWQDGHPGPVPSHHLAICPFYCRLHPFTSVFYAGQLYLCWSSIEFALPQNSNSLAICLFVSLAVVVFFHPPGLHFTYLQKCCHVFFL